MNSNPKLSYAIAAILSSGVSIGIAHAASTADTTDSEGIQEITVTAQRRVENMQDVPITIQALTSDTLAKLNVTTFDDFIKYLPNVTQASNGPGQSSITMRGLSVGAAGSQGSGSNGQIPNVAVYLDDQSVALPGRNLDVYAADLERIEVLEGPQGTLFGSGAEAGVLRYITNKPKLNVTEGNVDAAYSYTAGGNPNASITATLNLPIIADTLAVRAVVYDDSRGGYINNVPSTFTRESTDRGIVLYNGGIVPTNSPVITNASSVGSDINPLTYEGFRLSALYQITPDWDALLVQSYQDMNSQGVFYENPVGADGQTLAHDEVTLFNPSYDKDKFENTALTIDGKIGDLKLVYAGAYLVRNVSQQQDYTNYARGVYGDYYQCTGITDSPKAGNPGAKCYSPSTVWQDREKNTHLSQEIRLSTPDDWRLRGIGGLFYEQFKIDDDTEWLYKTVPTCSATLDVGCFHNIEPPTGETANNPNVRGDNTAFFDDFQRTIDQKAIFGSADFDIIPKVLTVTAGTRYYRFNEKELGGDVSSFGCEVYAPTTYFGPCLTADGTNLNKQTDNNSKYTGFKSRANVSWKVTDDVLVYYTWSQGFRPGGFNRGTGAVLPLNGVAQYLKPETYAPDSLLNNEIGFKTQWLDHRLEANGAVYQEKWTNTQVEFFDPGALGNLVFATNGPNYRVRGFELQLVARVTEGITVTGSSAWNSSSQTNSPALIDNNPASPGFGKAITGITNVYGAPGSPLANSPPFQMNLRIRDDIPIGDYKTFWQIGGAHQAHEYSEAGNLERYDEQGYTTYDASAGIAKDAWSVTLFGQNLTNVNVSTFTSDAQFIKTETVIRPRIAGLKFSYKF
jgi:outer membrane receptor protein involved in Fe transport